MDLGGAYRTLLRPAVLLVLAMPAWAQPLAITGATVIDGTGKPPLADAVVLIADGRISAVGSAREVRVPKGAKRLDAAGKYIIPGLMDAILLLYSPDLQTLIRYDGRYHELILEAAQLTLKQGVTTIFDTNRPPTLLAKARALINSGEVPGSRIYMGGHIIGMDGPLSVDFNAAAGAHLTKALAKRFNDEWEQGVGRRLLYMSPEELAPVIRDFARKVDFIKFAGSDHMPGPFISFSPRQQRVIVEEGHRAGRTVQAHVMSPEALNLVVESGVDLVTHGDVSGPVPIPDEIIRKLVERRVAISVLPVTQRNLDAREKYAPGDFTQYVKVAKINRLNMIKAGVTMLLATETSVKSPERLEESPTRAADIVEPSLHGQYGEGHVNALVALEEEGMDPMQILKTATSNTARAYKVDADLGTLEKGKLADLLILNANPLQSARNYGTIHSVIKDGKVIDRDALPLVPVLTRKASQAN